MESLISAAVRDDKIYTICQNKVSGYVNSRVYELKGGDTRNIAKTEKVFKLPDSIKGFKLAFIDVFDSSTDSHNKLWVSVQSDQSFKEQQNSSYKNWVGYINLNDMSLETDSSTIQFPTHENFPIDRYTINVIANEFGSALYVAGGELCSKKDKRCSIGNSFFKYNFTTKEWVDMTYSANGKLKPIVGHRSITIDNRYLVILGGYMNANNNDSERSSGSEFIYKHYSVYDLTVFDTFTNSWEYLSIKPGLGDADIKTIQFDGFLAAAHKDKVVILGGIVSKDRTKSVSDNPYLGVLDYNSRTWNWIEMRRDDSNKYFYDVSASDLLAYNNQLIILPGI
jgi:hypothetical protein